MSLPHVALRACYISPHLIIPDAHAGEDKATFKRNAYIKAANSIEHCKEKLDSGKEAQKLPGVGKGIVQYVNEFLEDGVMGERAKQAKAEQEGEQADGQGDAAAGSAPKGASKAGLAFLD